MSDPRILGQNVSLIIVENNEPLQSIRDVRNFELTSMLDILTEGYLGEKSDRRDSVYRGWSARMEFHFENRQILDFVRRVIDRARRRDAESGNLVINIQATLNFPNGDRPIVLLRDAFFGPFPMSFASRGDFGAVTMEAQGEDYSVV
jgi:hypothetical protein